MKKIKPIVLKDATKLTNSEMKKIYAGGTAMGEPDSSCTVYCDLHTGALVPERSFSDKSPKLKCQSERVGLPRDSLDTSHMDIYPTQEPEAQRRRDRPSSDRETHLNLSLWVPKDITL